MLMIVVSLSFKKMYKVLASIYPLLIFFLSGLHVVQGQDPLRFKKEVEALTQIQYDYDTVNKEVIVFTGSSSIRMWKDLQDYFPDHQIIRNGFGGSEMNDLLFYSDQLILKYRPDKVFIYEGDNDIAAGKTPSGIMSTTLALLERLEYHLDSVEVVLIAAKPSISRWSLKDKYNELNRRFEIYSSKKDNVYYADVWNIMLDENGKPKKELFLADSLHMNKLGYDLWATEIQKFMD